MIENELTGSQMAEAISRRVQIAETAGASPQAIQYHYDVGNDFFSLWLDKTMTYSAAMWDGTSETLEDAQTSKVAHHVAAARAAGRNRVLDIGCGWGSCLRHLVDKSGVNKAVGLTLSSAQQDWIRAKALANVEVRLESWEEHSPPVQYDAIISVGAFEHFCRPDYSKDQRRKTYRNFFETCHRLLSPGGWMSLQTQAYSLGFYSKHSPLSTIFPESDMPRLYEIFEAMDGLFDPEELHNRPNDYFKTLECWLERFSTNQDEIKSVVGADIYERYFKFLKGGLKGYSSDVFMLLRMSLRRLDFRR